MRNRHSSVVDSLNRLPPVALPNQKLFSHNQATGVRGVTPSPQPPGRSLLKVGADNFPHCRLEANGAVRKLHRIVQSVGATGGVYKGQGRNQCELMTRVY
eukprot:57024-Eustigmatos_ZCMA.PRE.2